MHKPAGAGKVQKLKFASGSLCKDWRSPTLNDGDPLDCPEGKATRTYGPLPPLSEPRQRA